MKTGLTRTDKKILYRAANMIARRREEWSCLAIKDASKKHGLRLQQLYSDFYDAPPRRCATIGQISGDLWEGLTVFDDYESERQRLIMLALFAEVGPEGVK